MGTKGPGNCLYALQDRSFKKRYAQLAQPYSVQLVWPSGALPQSFVAAWQRVSRHCALRGSWNGLQVFRPQKVYGRPRSRIMSALKSYKNQRFKLKNYNEMVTPWSHIKKFKGTLSATMQRCSTETHTWREALFSFGDTLVHPFIKVSHA